MKDFFLFINFNLILESRNLRTSKLCTKQPNYCLNYTFTRESHTIFGACFDTAIWCCHEPINQWLHSFQMEAALSLTASNCSSTTGTRRSWTNFVASICREKSWQLFRFSNFAQDYYSTGGALPEVDSQQDWEVVCFNETGNYTSLRLRRKLLTCDTQDRNITVRLRTSCVINKCLKYGGFVQSAICFPWAFLPTDISCTSTEIMA